MQSTDEQGQPTRVSGWLKRSEKHVQDKLRNRSEHFNAHDSPIAVAVFAPVKTRQRLAKSGRDLIYNYTPVYTENLRRKSSSNENNDDDGRYAESYEETDEEARDNYTYPDGHIIVSADNQGCIKVWRMDTGVYNSDRDVSCDSRSSNLSIPSHRHESLQAPKAESLRNIASAPASPRHRLHFGNLFSSQNRSKRQGALSNN